MFRILGFLATGFLATGFLVLALGAMAMASAASLATLPEFIDPQPLLHRHASWRPLPSAATGSKQARAS